MELIFWITGWLFTLGWFEYEAGKNYKEGRMPFVVFAIGVFLLMMFWPYSLGRYAYSMIKR